MACDVAACRACLATDTRLLSLQDASLQRFYRTLTGEQPHTSDGLPQQLCYECVARVRRCGDFRERCLRANDVLRTLLRARRPITAESLRSVDRGGASLLSPLQRCPQPPALPCRHDQLHATSSYESNDKKKNTDLCIKNEWILDDTSVPSPETSIKDDTEDTNNYIEVIIPGDKVKIDRDEVKIECCDVKIDRDEVNDDCDKVESDVKKPVAKDLEQDTTHGKKEKPKEATLKSAKRKTRKDCEKNEGDETNVPSKKKKGKGRKEYKEDYADEITLSHEEQLADLRKRQTSLNYTNSPYTCENCYKGFLDKITYDNHMQRHEPSSGAHACGVCATRFPDVHKMRWHVVAAHACKYRCRACEHISNTKSQARQHEEWHKGVTHQCKLCGETLRKRTTYFSHVRLRHPEQFMCGACGVSFGSKRGLTDHEKNTHKQTQDGEGKSLYCSECDIHFPTEEALKRHIVTSPKHCARKGFKCRICSEVLYSKEGLLEHGLTHLKKSGSNECEKCEATFPSSREFLTHIKSAHVNTVSSVRSFVCEVCGRTCSSHAALLQHQRTHTGEKPFKCSECPKRYSCRLQMQVHQRTHTGERPYQCDVCHKSFRRKATLKLHSWVHAGSQVKKPYSCKICNRGFTGYSNMTRHKKLHSGGALVACELCEKLFKTAGSLKEHVKHVHLKEPYPHRSRRAPRAAASPLAHPASSSEAT